MRFLSMIRADESAAQAPSEQLMAELGKLIGELTATGQLVSTAGLRPTAGGVRVRLRPGGELSVMDGPFTESKEVIAGCVAIGALFSLPVLLRPIALDTGWSTTGISAAMTIAFAAMAVGSMAWGRLSDRVGPRAVLIAGSLLLTACLALASLATSLLAFQLLFGAVVGRAAAAIFALLMACVTGWFDTRRSLAVSLVSAGMGMALLTMAPLAAWSLSPCHPAPADCAMRTANSASSTSLRTPIFSSTRAR